jgi:hypothetical protein
MRIAGIQGVRRGVHRTVTTVREERAVRHPDLSSFGTGFAAPDLIRAVLIDTLSARSCGSRVRSASSSSGTSPACGTRLSSSKRAEPAVNLWETRTAFLKPG